MLGVLIFVQIHQAIDQSEHVLLLVARDRHQSEVVGELDQRVHNLRTEHVVEFVVIVPVAHGAIEVDDEDWQHTPVFGFSTFL